MNFAKFLLKTKHEYRGHKQTQLNNLSVKKGLKLCKELEELTNDEYMFCIQLFTDGGYAIYQIDYFPEGNPTGRDRMILGVENQ